MDREDERGRQTDKQRTIEGGRKRERQKEKDRERNRERTTDGR